MPTNTETTPPTFREIRPDQIEVERDGKRIGSISQTPAWALRGAGRWTYWPDRQPPTPSFATLEEAKAAII